jgi:hypothetical protein
MRCVGVTGADIPRRDKLTIGAERHPGPRIATPLSLTDPLPRSACDKNPEGRIESICSRERRTRLIFLVGLICFKPFAAIGSISQYTFVKVLIGWDSRPEGTEDL